MRQLLAHYPQLPILVLSALDETIYAARMLALGVSGYIMKQASTEQFLVSLRRVLDGNKRKLNLATGVQLLRYAVLSHGQPPANSTVSGE